MIRNLLLTACAATIGSALTYLAVFNADGDKDKISAARTDPQATQPVTRSMSPEPTDSPRDTSVANTRATQNPSPKPRENTDAANTIVDTESRRRLQERQKTIEHFIALRTEAGDMSSRELNARIENRFQREPLDQQWATDKENSILQMFDKNSQLDSISPLYVTCKSVNCQVALSAAGDDQVDALSRTFFDAVMSSNIGMNDKFVSSFPDPSTGRLLFYISNNGNMDLFR